MFRRLILLLALWVAPAMAATLPDAPPLHPVEAFAPQGPAQARGALVWIPGTYGRDQTGPPPEPDLVHRMAGLDLDVWRFDRRRGEDPLAGSADSLARGLTALRKGGYRRLILAGHSRGAWIALTALAHPGLADAIIAVSPAAFGTGPARQVEAMAAWRSLWTAAKPGRTTVALVQLADDPYDPKAAERRDIAVGAAKRAGLELLSIFQPPEPRGHIGVYEPAFDDLLGQRIADFADPR